MASQDKLFEHSEPVGDFAFDKDVADVFDDMVSRSVPFYDEIQRMIAELACDFARDETSVYDVGCSTGTTIALLDRSLAEKDVAFVGLDNSQEMLDEADRKLSQLGMSHPYTLQCVDINNGLVVENASLVTLVLTLQFVRPLRRERTVRDIHSGLLDDGCLLLVEKLTSEDTMFNRLFINHYYAYKTRQGYSQTEITNKREALENILIPYRMEENIDLLKDVGFRHIEVFFRWYNFCGMLAVK